MEPKKSPPTLENLLSLHEKCQTILARRNDIPLTEVISFAENVGFEGTQEGTSHWCGRHPAYSNGPPAYNKVNFQKRHGSKKAKPYQVKQLVDFIREALPIEESANER